MNKLSTWMLTIIGIIGGVLLVAIITLLMWVWIISGTDTDEFSRAQLLETTHQVAIV